MPYWFNLTTRQVEAGDDPDRAMNADLLGPYETQAEAERALQLARERTEAWDEEDREWEQRGARSGEDRGDHGRPG